MPLTFCAGSGALKTFAERAGALSALVGALQHGTGIAATGLVGAFVDGTPWPMATVIAACGIGSLACALVLVPRAQVTPAVSAPASVRV